MHRVKYVQDINRIGQLSSEERNALNRVTERYKFRANEYYLGLIDWDDPDDPIRRIIIPSEQELEEWGDLDISKEEINYVSKGIQHKYRDTALLLLTKVCGSFCRFCFRKRIFMGENEEIINDVRPGLKYIREHPRINNVLLTGGEPFLLSTERLGIILRRLREIPHVNIIRIGSKMPVFNPYRILNDSGLPELLKRYSLREKRIYIITHINHPKELTEESLKAIYILLDSGAILCNQTPILRGVNDNPETLSTLMHRLSSVGVVPYYFFINRPTAGNRTYCVPVCEAFEIFDRAREGLSGLSKRARLVMSHSTGKLEIVGLDTEKIYLRYHRSRNPDDESRIMVFPRNDQAYWFDDFFSDDYDGMQQPISIN